LKENENIENIEKNYTVFSRKQLTEYYSNFPRGEIIENFHRSVIPDNSSVFPKISMEFYANFQGIPKIDRPVIPTIISPSEFPI
jgi:hypothetical protein